MDPIPEHYNQIAGQKVGRIEALSDGVFAIALTLLVLDLKVPVSAAIRSETDLLNAFWQLTPKLLSYLLSFLTLGIFWTGQTAQFNYIEKSDRHFNWISLFFLLFVSLMPFSTAFLSEHISFKFSIALYWLNIFAMGITLLLQWRYARRNGYIRFPPGGEKAIDRAIENRILIGQSLYAAGALLCFVDTYVSICVIISIQLNYALGLFGKSTLKRKKAKNLDPAADQTGSPSKS